ncbi:MAG: UDP-glucose 4-epimerase [Chlamydiae bacterium]|nr:UDP-glucose 4-epimerase [Chlamydiota bacterium]
MKCLVTGAAGFIGSHLCELLLAEGHQVHGIDNLVNGQLGNLASFSENPNFLFSKIDITNREQIAALEGNVDWLFHLAALADIVPSIEDPSSYFDTNVTGTLNLLEFARREGVQKFLYAASSSCYGLPKVFPTPETSLINPEYPYALTKYLGEELVTHWGKIYNLNTTSLRLFNVYGPRSRTNGTYGAVFGVFLAQKLKNKPFTVVGDGDQTRDFTFVTDVANAFYTAAQKSKKGKIYNVGSGGHYSVNRLIELLKGEVVYIPKRPGEPECTFADTAEIKKDLDWTPKVSFEEGVSKILNCIDFWSKAPVWEPSTIKEATTSWFNYLKD